MIDFSLLGNFSSLAFDTDLMDIRRREEELLETGETIEISPETPIYTDIPCHVSVNQGDKADTANNPTMPIVINITVYCNNDVDIKNGDYITMYIRNNNGETIQKYNGTAGEPLIYQGRIQVKIEVNKNG